jgi:pimeloyl-ACP methyl ester carboxylesterase
MNPPEESPGAGSASPAPRPVRGRLARRALAAAGAILALRSGAPARASEAPAPASVASSAPPVFAPLFVDCRGLATGAPTVILEAGAFGTSADWDFVLGDLAAGGRVCAYDRAGLGRSPPRPGERDVLTKAGELNGLLDQLGETGKVILVGHSNGALYIQAFARLWPGRVAGLVYVNGVGADDLDDPRLLADLRAERRASNLAVTAGRLGLAELVADQLSAPMALKGEAARRKREGLRSLARLKVARDEDAQIIPGLKAVRRLGDADATIPTVVITGAPRAPDALSLAWRAAEIVPAARARTAWILDMPGATHVSPLTRDRAYVAAAVNWLRSPTPAEAAPPSAALISESLPPAPAGAPAQPFPPAPAGAPAQPLPRAPAGAPAPGLPDPDVGH